MKIQCNQCDKACEAILIPKIIPVPQGIFKNLNDVRNPKYTFMLKAICYECGKYIKFAPQTAENIEAAKIYLNELEGDLKDV